MGRLAFDIVETWRLAKGLKTAAASRALGVTSQTFNGWKKRGQVSSEQSDRVAGFIQSGSSASYGPRTSAVAHQLADPASLHRMLVPTTAPLDLERIHDCIHVLAQVVVDQGRIIKPEKFAKACVFLYEFSLQAGSVPLPYSVKRLLETID